jgi:hypothetical protein
MYLLSVNTLDVNGADYVTIFYFDDFKPRLFLLASEWMDCFASRCFQWIFQRGEIASYPSADPS